MIISPKDNMTAEAMHENFLEWRYLNWETTSIFGIQIVDESELA